MLTALSGVVEKVVFHNDRTGNTVLNVFCPETQETVAVVTSAPQVWAGEQFDGRGFWQHNPKHGHQFNATKVTLHPLPSSIKNPLLFLQSSLAGIGPKWAQVLLDTCGEGIFEAFDKEDPAIRGIKGLGKAKFAALLKSWRDVKARRFLAATLSSTGDFTTAQAIAAVESICSNPDTDPYEVLTKDPYCFVRMRLGFEFDVIDKMALQIGVARDDPRRIEAAILHSLHSEENSGHCASPRQAIVKQASSLVKLDINRSHMDKVYANGHVIVEEIRGTQCLYDRRLHQMELEVGDMLKRLAKGIPVWTKQLPVSFVSLCFVCHGEGDPGESG